MDVNWTTTVHCSVLHVVTSLMGDVRLLQGEGGREGGRGREGEG